MVSKEPHGYKSINKSAAALEFSNDKFGDRDKIMLHL